MRVLMLGWEFPPYFAGGVGVVCQQMTASLASKGHDVTYLMPSGPDHLEAGRVRLIAASQLVPRLRTIRIGSALVPYSPVSVGSKREAETVSQRNGSRAFRLSRNSTHPLYGANLLQEVELFSQTVVDVVEGLELDYDVIHAHDWTTLSAGVALKNATGKPLLAHIHITEFDKSGGEYADPTVYAIEKAGMEAADRVIAVSHRVARQCVDRYHCDPAKIRVVHNAVVASEFAASRLEKKGKIVLFLGRVTLQKGPESFVEAARRVLDRRPDVTFVLSGSGDMLIRMIERSAELGMGPRFLFTGFVDREQVAELHSMADVFVMPSASEPFGIVPLEAMSAGVPTIVSRQSGVSEVIRHALKVDFWDVEDLAAKIIAALSYPTLVAALRDQGAQEAKNLRWDDAADKLERIYREVAHA